MGPSQIVVDLVTSSMLFKPFEKMVLPAPGNCTRDQRGVNASTCGLKLGICNNLHTRVKTNGNLRMPMTFRHWPHDMSFMTFVRKTKYLSKLESIYVEQINKAKVRAS